MSRILREIKIVLLSIVISFGISLVYAWNGPVSAPPQGNTYVPINVSTASQTKAGSLWAGAFLATGGGYFAGNVGIGESNPRAKLHIGGTAGIDGIMFPDGTLQTTAAACEVSAPPGSQTFTASGMFTVPENVRSVTVEVRGGGGGGGTGLVSTRSGTGAGGGGGAGGYGKQTFTVNPGENYSVNIGTGGSPSATGGTSSFGSLVSATGGNSGGNGSYYCAVGGGGSGGISSATYNVTGNSGSSGSCNIGGNGGGGVDGYGGGGRGADANGCCGTFSGSSGQQGQVIVSW